MNEEQYEDDPLLDAARLGLDVEAFQKTPGALAIIELAMSDLNDALLTLIEEADLMSPAAREAHGKARAAFGVMQYMKQCIEAGTDAIRQLNEEDEHE